VRQPLKAVNPLNNVRAKGTAHVRYPYINIRFVDRCLPNLKLVRYPNHTIFKDKRRGTESLFLKVDLMAKQLTREHTLSSQTDSIKKENIILEKLVYIELAAGVGMVGFGLYQYYLTESPGWIIFGGILLFLSISHWMKTRKNVNDVSRMKSGRSGENFVSKILREELPDDVYLLNDIDVDDGTKTAQNDHILVHRSGLYLIETKTYGGRLTGSVDDENWIQQKDINGQTTRKHVKNPISQNQFHREVMERFLDNYNLPFDPDDIHCYVAMVVKACEWNIDGDDSSVDYAWNLPQAIKKKLSENRYSTGDVEGFLAALGINKQSEPGDLPR